MAADKIYFLEWVNEHGEREPLRIVRPSLYLHQIREDITEETRDYLNHCYPGWQISHTPIVENWAAVQILS